ncbi:3670_t:CDS:2 [Funneliformis mosseae]|uniref:3670_t:CDS:1 n=1 Tax=Funneliformis mosseae TaxID=27381 RepID=A0A9N9F5A7_FUNMO|nr:3670_t:CDS:2 [Funneliformis mosseae]
MVRKKNKRHIQSTLLANETQSRSLTIIDTKLQKLVEKAYHFLMRELFSIKAFCDASSQVGLFSEAKYYRNKIDNHITDFIIQIGKGKKGWLSCGSVAILHQVTITERVVDLLNSAENKGSEIHRQIIIF